MLPDVDASTTTITIDEAVSDSVVVTSGPREDQQAVAGSIPGNSSASISHQHPINIGANLVAHGCHVSTSTRPGPTTVGS
jgi:hypothetical protein